MTNRITIQQVLAILEIPLDHTVASLVKQPTQPKLTQFKLKIRRQRRQLAKKYHPDLGHNPDRMKQINQLCDLLLASKIEYRPPPVQVFYHYTYSTYDSTSTATGGFS